MYVYLNELQNIRKEIDKEAHSYWQRTAAVDITVKKRNSEIVVVIILQLSGDVFE